MFPKTLKVAVGSLVVLVVFVLGFVSGCGTVHGICKDGRTAFTIAERVTRPLSEKQAEIDGRLAEDNLHLRLSNAQQEIVNSHQRARRFSEKDPMPVIVTKPGDSQ